MLAIVRQDNHHWDVLVSAIRPSLYLIGSLLLNAKQVAASILDTQGLMKIENNQSKVTYLPGPPNSTSLPACCQQLT